MTGLMVWALAAGAGAQGWKVEPVANLGAPARTEMQLSAGGIYGFVGAGYNLLIYDLSDPTSRTLVSRLLLPHPASELFVTSDTAYIAAGPGGLMTVDVTNLSAPTLLGTYPTPTSAVAVDVDVDGQIAYVASRGLQIVDVSDPSSPTTIVSFYLSSLLIDVLTSAGIACMADSNASIYFIDVSTPSSPFIRSRYSMWPYTGRLDWVGDLLYVAAGGGGLLVLNVSNPDAPRFAGSCRTPGNVEYVDVVDNIAYVADRTSLQIIDVANLVSPTYLGSYSHALLFAYGSTKFGDYCYVMDPSEGIFLVDVTNPAAPSLASSAYAAGGANGVYVSDGFAYVAADRMGVRIYDVTTPSEPKARGGVYNSTMGVSHDLVTSAGVAYVASGDLGLTVYDVSDPDTPWTRNGVILSGTTRGIDLAGDLAYMASGFSGLWIIDVSNPDSLNILGTLDTTDARGVATSGTLAFVADYTSGLQIVDVTTSTQPVLLATYDTPGEANKVFVAGDLVYVADGTSGIQIIDVSDPTSPTFRGSYAPTDARSVCVSGDVAYVAGGTGRRMQVLDVSDPSSPTLRGYWSQSFYPHDVQVFDGLAYLADGRGGLWILRHEGAPSSTTGVAATDGVFSDRVRVTWNASALADEYCVYRSDTTTGTKTPISGWQTGTTFDDLTVTTETVYHYWVNARNADGESGFSLPDSGWAYGVAPTSPTGVTASDGAYTDRVRVTWDLLPRATEYRLYRADYSTGTKTAISGWQAGTTFDDASADVGWTYHYWVTARNEFGESAYSASDTGWRRGVPPPAPTGVAAGDGTHTDRVEVTWDTATSATEYNLYRSDWPGGAKTELSGWQTATTFNDFLVQEGTTYCYWVKARNVWGESDYSAFDTGWRAGLPPPEPTGVIASDGTYTNRVEITWDAVTSASEYAVYRAESDTPTSNPLIGWIPTTTFHDGSAVAGVTYYYWVKARNLWGESGYSSYDTGWRRGAPPPAPTGVAASDGAYPDRVEIAWNTAADATEYMVYRAPTAGGTPTAISGWQSTITFNDTTAVVGTTYDYWVRARNAWGESGDSASDTGWLQPPALPAPTGLAASDGEFDTGVLVFCDTVVDATEYRFFRADSPTGTPAPITDWQADPYTVDLTAAAMTVYTYWAKARNPLSESDYSTSDTGWMAGPPFPPTNVSATDGTFVDWVEVTWDAVTSATEYRVYREPYPSGTSTTVSGWLMTTSFADTTADVATSYSYYVTARNRWGESEPSAPDLGWRSGGSPPDPPVSVFASDGEFSDHVRVSWWIWGGTWESRVYRSTSLASTPTAVTDWLAVTDFDDYSVEIGTTYYYWVKGRNEWGESGFSQPDSGWARGGVPLAPTNVRASNGLYADKVRVHWDAAADATEYRLFRAGSAVSSPTAVSGWISATSFDDVTAKEGILYVYWVVARNATGESPFSEPDEGWRESSTELGCNLELVGQIGGACKAVYVDGNYAYIGEGPNLRILDVSNPSAPAELGRAFLRHMAIDVRGEGNMVYVATGEGGLQIVDATNRAAPTVAGVYTALNRVEGVHVSGGIAYVATNAAGLDIVDVSTPASPIRLGFYDTPDLALDVFASGGLAYVADRLSGLQIIDVSTPAAPVLRGAFNTPGQATDVVVTGGLAYIADQTGGLQIVDVTNPQSPAPVGFSDTPHYARAVTVAGDYAFVADGLYGVVVVDISNPAGPVARTQLPSGGRAAEVFATGNLVYVAAEENGLKIVDVSTMGAAFLALYPTPGRVRGLNLMVATEMYVTAYGYGMLILNTGDPTSPTLLGTYTGATSASVIQVVNDVAYISNETDGLVLVDVTNPAAPTQLGSYPTAGVITDLKVQGNLVYMTTLDLSNPPPQSLLMIADVSDPTSPVTMSVYDLDGLVLDMDVGNGTAYVVGVGALMQIVDVSDPSSPTLRTLYSSFEVVRVDGNYLYGAWGATQGAGGIFAILDISNPDAPSPLGQLTLWNSVVDLVVSSDRAYLLESVHHTPGHAPEGVLTVIDISDRNAPVILTRYEFGGQPTSLAVWGDTAYVGQEESRVRVIDLRVTQQGGTPLGSYDTMGGSFDVAVSGGVACIGRGGLGLETVDVSDPSNPTRRSTQPTTGSVVRVRMAGNLAYLGAESGGFQIYDVTNPDAPTLRGLYDTDYDAVDVSVEGNLAGVNAGGRNLQFIDITNPDTPTLAGQYTPGSSHVTNIFLQGSLAFFAEWTPGFRVMDISDPTSLTSVGSTPDIRSTVAMTVDGNMVYVTWFFEVARKLRIVDVSDPGAPTVRGGYGASHPEVFNDVDAAGGLVALGCDLGVRVFDVSNPDEPVPVGTCGHAIESRGIRLEGNLIYVAASDSGFWIFRLPDPDQPPVAPTAVAASDGTYDDRVRVTWNSVAGAAEYLVFRATAPQGATWQPLGSWQSGTMFDDFAAVADVTYYYCVKARNAIGESGYSQDDGGWRRAGQIPWSSIRRSWRLYR